MEETTVATLKIIAEVLLGLGGLSGLVTVFVNRKKVGAETKQIESQTVVNGAVSLVDSSSDVVNLYKDLLDEHKKETARKITDLDCEVKDLRLVLEKYAKRIAYLMTGIQMLTEQLVNAGHKPCWTPDEWRPDKTVGKG